MKNTYKLGIGIIISLIIGLSSCKKDEGETIMSIRKEIKLTQVGEQIVESDNSFGLDFFKLLTENNTTNENLMISPLSISLALSMTYNGADTETKTAMENTLRFSSLTNDEININNQQLSVALMNIDRKVDFSIANSIWYRNNFSVLPDFISTNENFYNAEITALNFSNPTSKNIINNWVADKTNNKITEIIDNIQPNIVMYLINAIYFKGSWKYMFDKSKNEFLPFYLSDGSKKEVEMMQQTTNLQGMNNDDFYLVELPYGRANFVMDLFLPKDDKSISDIIENLNAENWNNWINNLKKPSETSIILPPFKFEYEKTLNDILSTMGMAIAFDANNANFSKINAENQLFISEVKHKTFIELNEEGTEAAAVTSVSVGNTSIDPCGVIVFDKPFMFVIREVSTGAILFIGIVENPER